VDNLKQIDRTKLASGGGADGPRLAARLGLFDATMIVMGGIVGSGIFINPSVVARLVHTPALILGAWVAGGAIALMGALAYGELGGRMPKVGGPYAYLSAAYHPALGFLYGWGSLLVIHAGGTAAVAVTFAKYFRALTGMAGAREDAIAVIAVVILVAINCAGVKAGSGVQSFFMVLRIAAIAMIVACGAWWLLGASDGAAAAADAKGLGLGWRPILDRQPSLDLLTVLGAAMVPVMFAYGGWYVSNYVAEEIKEPRKTLPRALVLGMLGVVALYVTVNFIYVEVLGGAGLAATETPASAAMMRAVGERGAALIGAAISLSTLGFLSAAMLTYPRLFFAMAADGLLPAAVARVGQQTRVPTTAIVLQGAVTIATILLGTYEKILSYVVVIDWVFFGLTASCLFVFRARERRTARAEAEDATYSGYRVRGHPWTTGIFVAIAWLIVLNTTYKYPRTAGTALGILAAGIPVYFLVRGSARRPDSSGPASDST
jgi:basic amino acid/polyamine antiporter, APA family